MKDHPVDADDVPPVLMKNRLLMLVMSDRC